VHITCIFLHAFEYFRGIAILYIFGGALLLENGWTSHSVPGEAIAYPGNDGTTLFVLTARSLLHPAFSRQVNYRRALVQKSCSVASTR
jgi:hypothetical protein